MRKLVLQVAMDHLINALPNLVIVNAFPGFVHAPSFYKDSGTAEKIAVRLIGRTPEVGARTVSMALLTVNQSYHVCPENLPLPIKLIFGY